MNAPVPDSYLGVWKRTLLRTPGAEDRTSTVFWLQTPHWHGDIRIPAWRPRCAGRYGLADCSLEELTGLAGQQGFAGITRVDADICRWQRRVDFQPPGRFDDVGRIEFANADRMLEYGVQQPYFEIWERLPDSTGDVVVDVSHAAEDTDGARPTRVLLATGRHFIHLRPRAAKLSQAESLLDCGATEDWLRGALDFEISFGTRAPEGWTITHSTLPWLENTLLPAHP